MPLRAALGNPFVLAAVAVVAIGIISYQILKNKKKVPASSHYRGPDRHDRSDRPEVFFISAGDTAGTEKVGDNPESEKPNNNSCVVRKRNIATEVSDKVSETDNTNVTNNSNNLPHSVTNSFDRNSESSSDLNRKVPNNETQETDSSFQASSSKTFVANISDEDSESSEESNSSLGSVQNDDMSIFSDESNRTKASSSTISLKKKRISSPDDSSEEMYKRKVCNYLKSGMESDESVEKSLTNSNDDYSSDDDSSDESGRSFSVASNQTSTSDASIKKLVLCKGCLEEYANAVAYPCKHCYLCLDCAIKVHRIYKKCSICNFVVKTFEQLKL